MATKNRQAAEAAPQTPADAEDQAAALPQPTAGGCYVRQPDGSLAPDPDEQPKE